VKPTSSLTAFFFSELHKFVFLIFQLAESWWRGLQRICMQWKLRVQGEGSTAAFPQAMLLSSICSVAVAAGLDGP